MSDKPTPMEMTLSVMFPSDYLKAADLKGGNVTVAITGIKSDMVPMVGGKKEKKWVVSITRTNKKFIIGKTNAWAMGLLFGDAAREWEGKKIILCPDMTRYGGEDVACIRICGSPDATPERSAAFAKAWLGDRKGGNLVARVKRGAARMNLAGVPVTNAEPERANEMPEEQHTPDDRDVFDPEPMGVT